MGKRRERVNRQFSDESKIFSIPPCEGDNVETDQWAHSHE